MFEVSDTIFSIFPATKEACFDCLPPYAASLAMAERNTYSRFLNALRQGYLPISQQTLQDDSLIKWAYNVALTRFNEIWEPRRQKLIAPLGDMVRVYRHVTGMIWLFLILKAKLNPPSPMF